MIDTTGQCSACGQTVGIDTIHTCSPQAPRPRVSEHTDAARLEALRDSMRPRVEGEAAWLTMDEHEAQGYDLPKRAVGSKSHWLAMADRWTVEAKAQRAAVARLTAEVERLREIAEEAINAARLAWHEGYDDAVDPAWSEKQLRYAKVDAEPHEIKAVTHFFGVSDTKAWVEELSARLAALSLPTNAPEATNNGD